MRNVNQRGSLLAPAMAAFALATFAVGARAQDGAPTEASQMQAGETQPQLTGEPLNRRKFDFAVTPDPADTTEPYTHWRSHIGTAAECVASLRLQIGPGAPYQYVSALVIRCDGFIMVPRSAFDEVRHGASADVIVTGAEGEKLTAPIPIAGWDRMVMLDRRVDYALLKVNDHHIRCLRLLSGDNTQSSLPVKIVYAVPKLSTGTTSGGCTSVTLSATVGSSSEHGAHYTLDTVKDANGDAVTPETVPVGAAVVDAETGAALGMIINKTGSLGFSTFADFSYVFNEVGLAPDRAAIKMLNDQGSLTAHRSDSNTVAMRRVPGGPVTLQGNIRDDYLKNYKTEIACMPDFQIDEMPVTNGEFRAWMQLPNVHAKAPEGWSVDEETKPLRRQDLPVLGVPSNEALACLAARDMRLPTEVEWQRAAKVTDLKWLNVLWQQWTNLADSGLNWRLDFVNYWTGLRAEEHAQAAQRAGLPPEPLVFAPGQSPEELRETLNQSGSELAGRIGAFLRDGFFCRFIHPVAQYADDVSIFGVRNVVLNAPELILSAGTHDEVGYKPFADTIDMYVSTTKYYRFGESIPGSQTISLVPVEDDLYYNEIGPRDIPAYYMLTVMGMTPNGEFGMRELGGVGAGGTSLGTPRGRIRNQQNPPHTAVFSREMTFQWHGFAYPEFRGAR